MARNSMLLFILLLLSGAKVYSQSLDSLGIDKEAKLNKFESEYFDDLFKDAKGDFSFNDKQAIFVTGNSGNKIIDKADYFNTLVKPWLVEGSKAQTFYSLLSEEEKLKTGGYDVIILSWVKVFTKRKQKKIVKKVALKK